MVATCDLAVAGRSAWFATPGVHIGLFCSTPMVALSRNVGRKQAMQMLLTGDRVEAEQAERWGLINQVVEDDQLDQAILDMTAKLTSKSPLTLSIGKEASFEAARLATELRKENLSVELDYEGRSLKAQMKQANPLLESPPV